MSLLEGLAACVPQWLLDRLEAGTVLPGYTYSLETAVLFGDLAGFTPLTEAMARRGPQGVEVLNRILRTVFGTLVHNESINQDENYRK